MVTIFFIILIQLGEQASFNNNFANPITKSREPNATVKEKEIGMARQAEVIKIFKLISFSSLILQINLFLEEQMSY